ncbi:MAG: type II toxin-antitoxin system Phd/YefM family antitoxin [Chloroflexota bacterium]
MASVTIRDLRSHGGEVIDRVERGERLTVTRDGRPVAELQPITTPRFTAEALLARWRGLPSVDSKALRSDVDEILSPDL